MSVWLAPVIASAALILGGCNARPVSVAKTDNPGLSVEILGDADGCRIYRFTDGGGTPRYFVRCQGGTTASWSETCGEHCTTEIEVQQVDK